MNAAILLIVQNVSLGLGYLVGIAISVLLLGYLVYSLVKPEKF